MCAREIRVHIFIYSVFIPKQVFVILFCGIKKNFYFCTPKIYSDDKKNVSTFSKKEKEQTRIP